MFAVDTDEFVKRITKSSISVNCSPLGHDTGCSFHLVSGIRASPRLFKMISSAQRVVDDG